MGKLIKVLPTIVGLLAIDGTSSKFLREMHKSSQAIITRCTFSTVVVSSLVNGVRARNIVGMGKLIELLTSITNFLQNFIQKYTDIKR